MAWRRLATESAALLRRGAPSPLAAASAHAPGPARAFSSAASSGPSREFLALRPASFLRGSSPALRLPVPAPPVLGRHGLRSIWSRCSSPALQARAAAEPFGASLAARAPLGVRPRLSGLNLLKGFGTGTASTVLTMMLNHGTAAAAQQAPPSKVMTRQPSGFVKNELSALWPLVRKLQLPIGLIFLMATGWQNPLGLFIKILLLIYCSRPSSYSIYLFLQEIRHREMGQNHVVRKEEVLHTRKIDVKDYKFFSVGTVELADRKVMHLIGMLGSWWIYRVSYAQ
ncbi:hypothetical protein ACP4OV_022130 [Aristida adscensionis]